jgi:hypothetical protein
VSASTSRGHQKPPRRNVPGGRWLSVALRAAHLLGVVWLGAAVHGAPLAAQGVGIYVLVTGLALFVLDLFTYPHHLKEAAGLAVFVKLALVVGIVASEPARLPLFWAVVLWSAIFSHAPANFRHKRLIGKAQGQD